MSLKDLLVILSNVCWKNKGGGGGGPFIPGNGGGGGGPFIPDNGGGGGG